MNPSSILQTRRHFLRQAACAALGASGLVNTIWDLRRINAATVASGTPDDYKALVCLFLYGGNDSNNVLVPTDTSDYAGYAAARQDLALPLSSLLPIKPRTSDGRTYGLHPNLPELQTLFASGRLALVANVGTLVAPVTRASFLSHTAALPPQLFSHADQSVQWQTSWSDAPPRSGWGGRAADLLASSNSNPSLSMNISVAGNNVFETGATVQPYSVSPSGIASLIGYNGTAAANARYAGVQALLTQPSTNYFEKQFGHTTKTGIKDNAVLASALASTSALATAFPDTDLGGQMNMIANLIAARGSLGVRRQVFFCSLGGYDTHGDQLSDQANLFVELSQAMSAFHAATVELGVESQVTTFTSSDFGRTLPSNGEGSDHGWGSHHMVMGGAVNGGDLYGTFPTLVVNGPDDTGEGRWIPTTSVDEYAATLATWFGVSQGDLSTVLPNIGRFATSNLGFMAS